MNDMIIEREFSMEGYTGTPLEVPIEKQNQPLILEQKYRMTSLYNARLLIACCSPNSLTVHVFHCPITGGAQRNSDLSPIEISVDQHHIFVAKNDTDPITHIKFAHVSDPLQPTSVLVFFGKSSTVHRYSAVSTTIPLSRVFQQHLDQASSSPADQPATPTVVEQQNVLQRNLWTRMKSVTLTSHVPDATITAQECCESGDWLLVAMSDGTIKRISTETLETLSEVTCSVQESLQVDNNKKRRVDGELYVTSMAISPNYTCFCALMNDSTHVKMFVLPLKEENRYEHISHRFELNFLNHTDQWDLLIVLRKLLTKAQILEVCTCLERRRNEMNNNRPFYALKYERLFALLNRLAGGDRFYQMVNAQANIFIMCINDMSRHNQLFNIVSNFSTAKTVEELNRICEQKFDSLITQEHLIVTIPICNWTLMYVLDIYRNIKNYIPVAEKLFSTTTANLQLPPRYYYGIFQIKNKSTVEFIQNLVLLTCVCFTAYHQQSQHQQNQQIQTPLFSKEQAKKTFEFLLDLNRHSEQLLKDHHASPKSDVLNSRSNFDGLKNLMSKPSAQNMSNLQSSVDKGQMLDYLDLVPHFSGLLASEDDDVEIPTKSKNKKEAGLVRFDVVTRNEIRVNQSPHRVCRTCSRVSNLDVEGLSYRWAIACPMCAGYWCITKSK
ncbi:mediator of RNA polymerase II transcription subunit 16 [Acrasis kona]|uniref:Mediator of RNA polymerase II transcription subunit 16 n=1 Tax=Acrasis kona TaxID=1008807 RepID=A0AAW2YZ17_9EUKA